MWHPRGTLYFSGANRITQRDADGTVSVFREPAGSNGLLIDQQGRLVTCESRNHRITRTEPDGGITVLADAYEGKRFNSPNDLTIDSQGRIYFSDPQAGLRKMPFCSAPRIHFATAVNHGKINAREGPVWHGISQIVLHSATLMER